MKLSRIWIYPPAIILGSLLIMGCASMARGTKQDVWFTTEPVPAQVVVRSEDSFNTVESGGGIYYTKPDAPLILSLHRGSSHTVEVAKENYKTQIVNIRREVSVIWWVLDAFTLGIGNLVDALTGALFDLKPDRVHVVLEPRPLQEPTAP